MSKRRERDRFVRVVDFFIRFYLIVVCCWAICWLAGEILTKMGVG